MMRLRQMCCELAVVVITLQNPLLAADSIPGAGLTGSGSSGSSMGTLILPHGPAAKDLRQIRRDRDEIREDRTNIRFDERLIQRNRQDVHAAEHDIRINPQNAAADQARISADKNAISGAKSDLNANRQDIRKDQHQEQQARRQPANKGQQQSLGQQGLGTSNDSHGFFGPLGSTSRTHATFGRHHLHPGNAGVSNNVGSGATGTGHTGTSPHPGHRR